MDEYSVQGKHIKVHRGTNPYVFTLLVLRRVEGFFLFFFFYLFSPLFPEVFSFYISLELWGVLNCAITIPENPWSQSYYITSNIYKNELRTSTYHDRSTESEKSKPLQIPLP